MFIFRTKIGIIFRYSYRIKGNYQKFKGFEKKYLHLYLKTIDFIIRRYRKSTPEGFEHSYKLQDNVALHIRIPRTRYRIECCCKRVGRQSHLDTHLYRLYRIRHKSCDRLSIFYRNIFGNHRYLWSELELSVVDLVKFHLPAVKVIFLC